MRGTKKIRSPGLGHAAGDEGGWAPPWPATNDHSGGQSAAQAGALGPDRLGFETQFCYLLTVPNLPEPQCPPPENGVNKTFS